LQRISVRSSLVCGDADAAHLPITHDIRIYRRHGPCHEAVLHLIDTDVLSLMSAEKGNVAVSDAGPRFASRWVRCRVWARTFNQRMILRRVCIRSVVGYIDRVQTIVARLFRRELSLIDANLTVDARGERNQNG